MTTLPRITIITPSFNQGAFIGQTIHSVLQQGYSNLEYLVLDGGSTDETVDVLRSYGPALRWVSERDRGQAHAINKGLHQATGEIVAFLNSDDCYEPGALQAVGEWFAANPSALWASGKCRIIDRDGREVRRAITWYKNMFLHTRSYASLLVLNYISQPATFWRRNALARIGLLDEHLHYTLDYDYWLRLGQHRPMGFINRYLARFRVHPASKGGTGAQAQFHEELRIAQRYTRSGLLLGLHRLHIALIVGMYGLMNKSAGSRLQAERF